MAVTTAAVTPLEEFYEEFNGVYSAAVTPLEVWQRMGVTPVGLNYP